MSVCLLDVNVLIALHHEDHDFHGAAIRWFSHQQKLGWATCPATQSSFIRITTQPTFPSRVESVELARRLLSITIEQSATHHHWAETEPIVSLLVGAPAGLQSRQLTDYYLVKHAETYGGKLATLDRRMANWLQPDLVQANVEFIA